METNYGKEAREALSKARDIYNKHSFNKIYENDNGLIEKLSPYKTKFFDFGKKAGFEEGILQKICSAEVFYGVK